MGTGNRMCDILPLVAGLAMMAMVGHVGAVRISLQPMGRQMMRPHSLLSSMTFPSLDPVFDDVFMSSVFDGPFIPRWAQLHTDWPGTSFGLRRPATGRLGHVGPTPRVSNKRECAPQPDRGNDHGRSAGGETAEDISRKETELKLKEAELKLERDQLERQKEDERIRLEQKAMKDQERQLQRQIRDEREKIERREAWVRDQREARRRQEEEYARREREWTERRRQVDENERREREAEERRKVEAEASERKRERERRAKQQQQQQHQRRREQQRHHQQQQQQRQRQWEHEQMEQTRRGRERHSKDQYGRNRNEKQSSKSNNDNNKWNREEHVPSAPTHGIANLQLKGYNPEDITIVTRGNKMMVSGLHICDCDEDCFEREFQRSFTIPTGISTSTLQARIDETGVLTIRGRRNSDTIRSRTGPGVFTDTSVHVEGAGTTTTQRTRDSTCGGRKVGIKLKKMNQRTGELVDDVNIEEDRFDNIFEGENGEDGITIEVIE